MTGTNRILNKLDALCNGLNGVNQRLLDMELKIDGLRGAQKTVNTSLDDLGDLLEDINGDQKNLNARTDEMNSYMRDMSGHVWSIARGLERTAAPQKDALEPAGASAKKAKESKAAEAPAKKAKEPKAAEAPAKKAKTKGARDPKATLTTHDVALETGYSVRSIRNYARAGVIKGHRGPHDEWFFTPDTVEFLKARRKKAAGK